MPHRLPFQHHSSVEDEVQLQVPEAPFQEMGHDGVHDGTTKQPTRRPSKIRKAFRDLFKRHEGPQHTQHQFQQPDRCTDTCPEASIAQELPSKAQTPLRRRSSQPESTLPARRAIPSLPRPQTFHRQDSERRERLEEVPPSPLQRRAISGDRRRGMSERPPRRRSLQGPLNASFASAPQVTTPTSEAALVAFKHDFGQQSPRQLVNTCFALDLPDPDDGFYLEDEDDIKEEEIDEEALYDEYDRCWILNLGMHFRDKSNREKFFVTYAETPSKWRRLTISLDYRNAPPESLEDELSNLHFQRDKSLRIYKAIRESLPEIQYYDTVTNLKLETTPEDGQLHVHVREDANEIIPYPSVALVQHVGCPLIPESQVHFESHLSGFVYKVRLGNEMVVKKEIPGPDTIDEFLYEVNALDMLQAEGCKYVVRLKGLVTDDAGAIVKGLLISFASHGALVDTLYDLRNTEHLPWHRREKWAKQIVTGLSAIHEAGFVQGDFTLSNIVINEQDDAQIIDINRRGCPVGWEPPEFNRLIESGQRIGMCIGVKTDLFQLGMVLWALAEECDEPERVERPLPDIVESIPEYFRNIVRKCLSDKPQNRISASAILSQFPVASGTPVEEPSSHDLQHSDQSISTSHRSDKEYIDPDLAVTIEEIKEQRRQRADTGDSHLTSGDVTYVGADSRENSVSYRFESSGSWIVPHERRGRSPVSSSRRRPSYPYRVAASSTTSVSVVSSCRGTRSAREYVITDSTEFSRPTTSHLENSTIDLTGCEATRTFNTTARLNEDALVETSETQRPAQQDLVYHGFSLLPHQDSGFDEPLIQQLEDNDESKATACEGNHPPRQAIFRTESDLSSPGLYTTAATTPVPEGAIGSEKEGLQTSQ